MTFTYRQLLQQLQQMDEKYLDLEVVFFEAYSDTNYKINGVYEDEDETEDDETPVVHLF